MDLIKKINLDKIRNAAEDAINQAKPKTDVEARIYEALSHKNWGSSSTLMNEIARDSFDYDRYATITKIIWESLQNQRPAAWRVVFKALTLLEHLIKNGSERCVDDARNHSHVLRALFNFNYYEGTVDRGIGLREKSKQIVELLGDDERVREERTKAKQLREKFGGSLGGVSGGGGGGGGTSYAGYGNQDNQGGGYNGGSSGYGDSGIGSSSAFSGRYNDTNNETSVHSAANDAPTPTFAAVPEKKKKKSKKSKKKKEKSELPAVAKSEPAPEIDLLAMDDPIPASESNDSGFDAFQTATTQPSKVDSFDAFGASPEAPKAGSFDAFGGMNSAQSQQNQQPQFDAFNSASPVHGQGSTSQSSNTFNAFSMTNVATNNNVNDMFGNMSMNTMPKNTMNNMAGFQNNNSINSNVMGGGKGKMNNVTKEEDDFGDFADGKTKKIHDPLSTLISLDGLTKNNKNEDKTNAPIIFNQAAQNFVQNKAQIQAGASKLSADIAFSGVDGLNNIQNNTTQTMSSNNLGNAPVMNSSNNMMNMGMNNMYSSSNGMNMGMMNANNMNTSNNSMSMNAMGMGSMMDNQQNNNSIAQGGNMMGGMSGQQVSMMGNQQVNMMGGMSGQQSGNMNMMGGQQSNMMGGMSGQQSANRNMMGGQQNSTMGGMGGQQNSMMRGMGGQQSGNNMNMMGGQPMGGGGF